LVTLKIKKKRGEELQRGPRRDGARASEGDLLQSLAILRDKDGGVIF
jgi:hypothetical protein